MSVNCETSENRLFLTCPSGFMEPPVRKTFGGNSYFYTAMGVVFRWDVATQRNLTGFLQRRDITEILFLGNLDNPLYDGLFQDSVIPVWKPWETKIAGRYTDFKAEFEGQSWPNMKTSLPVADHLVRQIVHLRDTSILGRYIAKEAIKIGAFVYDPSNEFFWSAAEVKRRAMVLQGICFN